MQRVDDLQADWKAIWGTAGGCREDRQARQRGLLDPKG
jgi:hypothetical protein